MANESNLAFFDNKETLEFAFPLAYNPEAPQSPTTEDGVTTHFVEVDKGIKISCRYFVSNKRYPTILYFHDGNDTIADHYWMAAFFLNRNFNIFMVDYRGFGASEGKPSFDNLLKDAHTVYKNLRNIIRQEEFDSRVFVMGRDIGSIPAIELALYYQNELKGLIIESGIPGFPFFGRELTQQELQKLASARLINREKMKSISLATLILHGDKDRVIPIKEAMELYDFCSSSDRVMSIISGAGHKDIMVEGQSQYFNYFSDFMKRNS